MQGLSSFTIFFLNISKLSSVIGTVDLGQDGIPNGDSLFVFLNSTIFFACYSGPNNGVDQTEFCFQQLESFKELKKVVTSNLNLRFSPDFGHPRLPL